MLARSVKIGLGFLLAGVVVCEQTLVPAQEIVPPAAAVAAPVADAPVVPKGVEVLARGPIHEAFASLTGEAVPTKSVGKQPPKPLDEMPPDEKPEGDMIWISGYWAWDDDRSDFLWVSGIWRATPPGKQWVAGYWREDGTQWQWVGGFWAAQAAKEQTQEVTYLAQPPALPEVGRPAEAPNPDSFFVPGNWVWKGDGYRWQAGYWAKVQPGYVWVAGYYRWTPSGYIYIPGYWDYALSKRGILYAPVYVDSAVVGVSFVYTPAYAVRDTIVVDSLFVRPSHCHYYFGDYYGVEYRDMGYESCVVYSSRHYDSIIVYERWEHRREPDWIGVQINVYNDRYDRRAPRPPRTLVQQNTVTNNTTIVNNTTIININVKNVNTSNTMLATPSQIAASKGVKTVPVDAAARVQAKQQAQAVQQVSAQRVQTESVRASSAPSGATQQPRVTTLSVPKQQPIASKSVAAPTATTAPAQSGVKSATTSAQPSATTSPPDKTGVATKPAAATSTGPAIATNPPTSHPATQLQPALAPPPKSPFGSGGPAASSTSVPSATKPGSVSNPATPGTMPAQAGLHPNPPLKPLDQPPAHKPPPPKDKVAKDKDKDRDR